MINKLLYIILLSITSSASAQVASGRIISGSYAIKGILVVNMRAEREVRTDILGMFSIPAKTGDILVITDAGIKPVNVVVDDDFLKHPKDIIVEVNDAFQLDAVVIEQNNALTSEALGLVPQGQKKYTQQERKLSTAGEFKAIHLLGLLFGSVPVDPIINAINGRTRMLKNTVAIEKKESALELLNGMFTEDEIVEKYNIPHEYVQGFLFYCVEDVDLLSAVKAKNSTLINFLMSALAIKYVTIINEHHEKPGEK